MTEELADLGDVEVAPKMEGYQMFTILAPKKTKSAAAKHISTPPNKTDEPVKAKKSADKKPAAPKAKPEPKDDDEIF